MLACFCRRPIAARVTATREARHQALAAAAQSFVVCSLVVFCLCIPTVQAARQGDCICDKGVPCAVEQLMMPFVQARCGGGVISGVSALAMLAWMYVLSLAVRGLLHLVCRHVPS